ncbi:MAG: hypothetical protein V3S82_10260 [Dehalococcoidia bacterium]
MKPATPAPSNVTKMEDEDMTVGQSIQSYLRRMATKARRGEIKDDRQQVRWAIGFREHLGKKWRGRPVEDLVTSPEGHKLLEGWVFRDRPKLHGVPPTIQTVCVENGKLRECFQLPDLTLDWQQKGRPSDPRPRVMALSELLPGSTGGKEVETVAGSNGTGVEDNRKFYRRKGDQPELPLERPIDVAILALSELTAAVAGFAENVHRVAGSLQDQAKMVQERLDRERGVR